MDLVQKLSSWEGADDVAPWRQGPTSLVLALPLAHTRLGSACAA